MITKITNRIDYTEREIIRIDLKISYCSSKVVCNEILIEEKSI